MAKMVKVVNTCLVPPALPTPKSPIWLSNLDLFAAATHVRAVYSFRNSSSDPFPSPAASIKASLARVLVSYYPFGAGRFVNSTQRHLEIRCIDEGPLFFEAVSDLTLDEFGVYKPVARIREAIEKLDEEYLLSAVDYLELHEDKRRLARSAGNFTACDRYSCDKLE